MHTKRQQMIGSGGGAGMQRRGQVLIILLGLLGYWQTCLAADFTCTSAGAVGDVACLINAINAANANGDTNTITLAAGTYTLTAINNGMFGDTTGLPVITSPLTIQGAGAETTIIERDANALETFRLLRIAMTGTLTVKGLTLRGGKVFGHSGGGILNTGALTLTNCTLTDNTAEVGGGGGIANSYVGPVTLTDCILVHNAAGQGGGIAVGRGPVTLTNSTVAYNTARQGNGGGGIINYGTATLTNSTVAYNTGSIGGSGITNWNTLTLTNSTVAYNTASINGGGGIFNYGGTLTLTNSTVAYNTASFIYGGGGINNRFGPVTLQNTILALNTAPDASSPSDDCSGAVTSLGTNLIGDLRGCTSTRPEGGSDLTGDPGLEAFTTGDGGPGHGHFPLQQNSQATDAGDDNICPDTDQLGQPRVGQCDIGAIEFQPSDTTPPTVTIVSVTPDTLWPPNGKLVQVTVVATITDTGSGVDPSTPAYAVEDEYESVQPTGSFTLGADGRYTATIPLQASRNGNDTDERLYTITVSAQDNAGNTESADVFVTVPRDQGQERSSTAR